MNFIYNRIIKPILFRFFDPETSHTIIFTLLKIINSSKLLCFLLKAIVGTKVNQPFQLKSTFTLKNRIGLAAGFDKNGEVIHAMDALGFGFIEVGTVTLRSQKGNDYPRVFRLTEDLALINRMGFPNKGSTSVFRKIYEAKKRNPDIIIGVNLGKNKEVSIDKAYVDYYILASMFGNIVDYITLNISSPNTTNLTLLQNKEYLEKILCFIPHKNKLLIKISPDIQEDTLKNIIALSVKYNILGIIASNTSTKRNYNLKNHKKKYIQGGISGNPLFYQTLTMIRKIRTEYDPHNKLIIIASGGISSSAQYEQILNAGASCIQLYTALVYHGPTIVKDLLSINTKQ